MAKYLQYLFAGVFLWEALLYVYFIGTEQVMFFEYDMQFIRLTIMLASVLVILVAELMKEAN
jgi:hypothetical protein